MYLKRIFGRDENGAALRNADGTVKPPIGVRLLRYGEKQRFSPDLVLDAVAQGWMVFDRDTIKIMAENGEASYRVIRTPGYYCCACGIRLPDGAEARQHTETHHDRGGYERINYYDCVRD